MCSKIADDSLPHPQTLHLISMFISPLPLIADPHGTAYFTLGIA